MALTRTSRLALVSLAVSLTLPLAALPARAVAQDSRPAKRVAQGPSPFGRGPFVQVSLAGPKAIRQAILPTNLGALIGGAEFRSVWTGLHKQFRDALQEAPGDDAEEHWLALEKRLLGYAGRIDAELHLARRPRGNRMDYHVSGHMIFWSDGHTDMAALQKEVSGFLLDVSGEESREAKIAGHTVRMFGGAGDDGITLPLRYEKDHLVVFFGSRIDHDVEQGLARLGKSFDQRLAAATKRSQAHRDIFSIEFDLLQVSGLMDDEFRRNDDQRQLMRRLLGADTWDMAGASIKTVGPRVQIEVAAGFRKGNRGIFGGLLPDIGTLPVLLGRAPAGTPEKPPAFACGHIDWSKLYNAYIDLIASFRFFGGKGRTVAEVKAEANKELGFDVEKDLLASVGTDVLVLATVTEAAADRNRAAPDADGLAFVIRVTDDAKFKKALDMAVPKLRPGDAIRHAGVDLLPVRFLDRGEYIGRTQGAFFYAVGERGLAAIKAYLDEKPRVDAALPKPIQRTRRLAPRGFNLAGILPTRILKDSLAEEVLWEIWREIRYEFPREMRDAMTRESLIQRVGLAAPILKKYRLDRLVLLGGFENNHARILLVW